MAHYVIDVQQAYRSTGFFIGKTQTPSGYTYTVTDTETGEIVKSGRAFNHKQATYVANKIVASLNLYGSAAIPKDRGASTVRALDPSGAAYNLRKNADMYEGKGKHRKAAKLRKEADEIENG